MSEKKIRVLAIAPYNALAIQLQKILPEFPSIDLTIHVGDRYEGIQLAEGNYHSNFEVILSRGGTAQLISRSVTLPVVEIETSIIDILQSLTLANITTQRFAVVGYSNFTKGMEQLRSLLHYQCSIYTIRCNEDIDAIFSEIGSDRDLIVFGDVAGYNAARISGFRSYLITSGPESLRQAFHTITILKETSLQLSNDNNFYRSLLQNRMTNTLVLSPEGKLIYASNNNYHDVLPVLRRKLQEEAIIANSKSRFQLNNNLYTVYAKNISDGENSNIVFDYSFSHVSPGTHSGITYYDQAEAAAVYNQSINSIIGVYTNYWDSIKKYSEIMDPIFLSGEQGIGKAQFSMLLYLSGPHIAKPYIQIDAHLLDNKSWSFLLEHHQSPLCDTGNTICFTNLDILSNEKLRGLLAYLLSSQTCTRNRVIVSFNEPEQSDRDYHRISRIALEFKNRLHCSTVSLEPLRNNPELIRNAASLYLSQLNYSKGKTIVSLEPEAVSLLAEFDWPQNYYQFQRVMDAVYTISAGNTITAGTVQEVLENESQYITVEINSPESTLIDLNKSLSEINREIARIVLRRNNGNRTNAAESLQISRATLWKMLKEDS